MWATCYRTYYYKLSIMHKLRSCTLNSSSSSSKFVGMWAGPIETTVNGCLYIHNVEGVHGIPTDWTIEIDSKPKDPKA